MTILSTIRHYFGSSELFVESKELLSREPSKAAKDRGSWVN